MLRGDLIGEPRRQLRAPYVPPQFALREGTALRITTEGHCFNAYRERVQITIDVKT